MSCYFITKQIWDLPLNEKDTVAFFQEDGVLPKRRLCGSGHEAKTGAHTHNIEIGYGDPLNGATRNIEALLNIWIVIWLNSCDAKSMKTHL